MRLWRLIAAWFSRRPRYDCTIYLDPGSECRWCMNDPKRLEPSEDKCPLCRAPRNVLEQLAKHPPGTICRLPANVDISFLPRPWIAP